MVKFYLDPKFWTVFLDAVISTILFFVAKYGAPDMVDNVKFIVVIYQPIFGSIILSMFQAQQEAARMGNAPSFMARYR